MVGVKKGETYKLTVGAVIGGRPMSTTYVEGKCDSVALFFWHLRTTFFNEMGDRFNTD